MISNRDTHEFSDDAVRRFLLGRLTAAEQTQFEQQLFTNSELEARVRLAEIVLAEDYAGRRLGQADQALASERFLVSGDRERLYSVSQALRHRFAPVTTPERSFKVFRLDAPVWRYAFAAMLLLLTFATVWRVTKERRVAFIPPAVPFKPKPAPTSTPVEAHHPTKPSAPEHQEAPANPPSHEPERTACVLDTKSTVAHPAIVKLSGAIQFQVSLPEPHAGAYRADIFTIAYQPVFSFDFLESTDGSKLEFTVPAGVLKPGDYKVKFMHLGKDASEVVYYFRVE